MTFGFSCASKSMLEQVCRMKRKRILILSKADFFIRNVRFLQVLWLIPDDSQGNFRIAIRTVWLIRSYFFYPLPKFPLSTTDTDFCQHALRCRPFGRILFIQVPRRPSSCRFAGWSCGLDLSAKPTTRCR